MSLTSCDEVEKKVPGPFRNRILYTSLITNVHVVVLVECAVSGNEIGSHSLSVYFWVVMQSSFGRAKRFGGKYHRSLQGRRANRLYGSFLLVACVAYSSLYKMEVLCSTETSGCLRNRRRCNSKDHTLQRHRCENARSSFTNWLPMPVLTL
jgi:hypothetical protein